MISSTYTERDRSLKSNLIGEMDRAQANDRKRIGSVRTYVNMNGERILGGRPELKKSQMEISEMEPSRAKELHLARRDIGRLDENRKVAESTKAQAESELCNARKTVKELTLQIEELNLKSKSQKWELETLKKLERHDDGSAFAVEKGDSYRYAEVMREIEFVKLELSKLKLDMASVLEAKWQADKETEATVSRMRSYSSSVVALRKEIEDTNEEHVLVQLAKIEAVRELGAIEAQREAEASQFSDRIGRNRNRIKDVIQELDHAKELENKLAITASDVDVLQNELELVRAMNKRVERNDSGGDTEVKGREEELQTSILLQSATEELDAAKKELASIKEEAYKFMASMDVIRDELKHVTEETARLGGLEEKTDLTVQNLNSKLLKAKTKLKSASAAEEKAKSIVSNLSVTLLHLQEEAEAAKKEREFISQEASSIRLELQKTDSEIDLVEDKLQAAMEELESIKASEATTLESLKALTEKTMRGRASASQHNSLITISSFEYEYLTGHAEGAKEVADKKVVASQAWIEALKASEKEIMMQTEIAHREIKELRVVEEQEVYRTEKSLVVKRAVGHELRNWEQRKEHTEAANLQLERALPRKSTKDNGILTPERRAKPRRPSLPGARYVSGSPSIALKKRKKVMPNLAKILSSKGTQKDL